MKDYNSYVEAESPQIKLHSTSPMLQESHQHQLEISEPNMPRITTEQVRLGIQGRKDIRRQFLNLPYPILLFGIFIAMVLTHTPIHKVYLADHGISTVLNPKPTDILPSRAIMNFMNIRGMQDIPQWINNSVLPAVFTKNAANGTILPPQLQGRVSSFNQLVGAVEFSVLNSQMTDCQSDSLLAKRYGPCFDFDSDYDIKEGNLSTRNIRRLPWYTMYIPIANPDPYARFKRWQDEGSVGGYYLSMATREFHVKITTYNGELDMFSYMHFKIEVEQGGSYSPTYKVQSVPTNPYTTSSVNVVLDALVGLLFLRILVSRLLHLKRQLFKQEPWNCEVGISLIEWCTIIMIILYYAAWIQVCKKFFSSHFEDQLAQLSSFYDNLYKLPLAQQRVVMATSNQPILSDFIDSFAPAIEFVYVVSIVACLQLAVHVLAAFQFHPTMNILTNTIISSLKRLGSFLVIFLLVVIALATSGCLLFGPQLDEFSSLHKSMVTCINMLFGGYSYDLIKDINDLAIIWFWVSQSIVTLVLVNIMLAVIIAAHQEVVDVGLGKRSFIDEFALTVKDMIRINIFRRRDYIERFEQYLNVEPEPREVWTAKGLEQALGLTWNQATNLIKKLKIFANTVDAPVTKISQISVQEARIGIKARRELRRHFINAPFPFLLFIAFIGMVLTHTPIHQVYKVDHGITTMLNPSYMDLYLALTSINFKNIRKMDDIPKWINGTVIPSVFTYFEVDGATELPDVLKVRISSYNQLVGALEISVFNTQSAKCQSDNLLASDYGPCFDFESKHEVTDGNLTERNTRTHPWYSVYMPYHIPNPYKRFTEWAINGTAGGYFLSMATREVHVKITTYNGELDIFSYIHFKIEVDEGGTFTPTYKIESVPTNPYATDSLNIALDVIVGIFMLRIFLRRLWHLKRQMFRQEAWTCDLRTTIIEWITLGFVALYYLSWFSLCKKFFGTGFEEQFAKLNDFYDELYKLPSAQQPDYMHKSTQPELADFIDTFAPAIDFLYTVSIVACLQLVCAVCSPIPSYAHIKRLGSFCFVFLLVVVALATSGCLLFGPQLEEFSSLHRAMVTCINMLFGGYSYELIKDANDMSLVWFWASQTVVTLVLVNIMLAVIIAAHQEIVDNNNKNRSILDELFLVTRDIFKHNVICRPNRFEHLEERLQYDAELTDMLSADQLAKVLQITERQAEKMIVKLKKYASTSSDWPVSTNRVSAGGQETSRMSNEVLVQRVNDLESKMDLMIELLRRSQRQY
ncbi:Polycystin Cation Channel (PCC) Family [Thraustotheca clavata]|uniref:Polycystin Cation Channel (PCC) Family n=1 Tax=Thraustotheca clavata TaxID=74557 RepID=A0A1V9ZCY9_9STRA|nr:Polycystin Cation Channel (PCC) Family [Thraustotheca clavata]